MSSHAFRSRRDIWVEANNIEAAIGQLRRQSRELFRLLKQRRLGGRKPSDKRRDKRWLAYRSRNFARRDQQQRLEAERQRTLVAAWEAALERRRAGSGGSGAP